MKIARHKMILELINKYEIATQEELAEKLIDSGFIVTQATVSRDIRELSLIKIAVEGKGQKYAAVKTTEKKMNRKLLKILKEGFVSIEPANALVVVKTEVGMAMAVAAALDAMDFSEIAGCIAGDDTIFCAIRQGEDAESIINKILKIVSE